MKLPRRVRQVRDEGGYSVVELLTVMAILGVVMGALTTLFVQGSNAEVDLNNRFRAQTEARAALDRFRRDAHTACAATLLPSSTAAWGVQFTFRGGGTCSASTTYVTWCAKPTLNASQYELWRVDGVLNNSQNCVWGTTFAQRYGGSLTPVSTTPVGSACSTPANLCIFSFVAQSTSTLAKIKIDLPVNTRPSKSVELYELVDEIALRNSCRVSGACTT